MSLGREQLRPTFVRVENHACFCLAVPGLHDQAYLIEDRFAPDVVLQLLMSIECCQVTLVEVPLQLRLRNLLVFDAWVIADLLLIAMQVFWSFVRGGREVWEDDCTFRLVQDTRRAALCKPWVDLVIRIFS